MATGRTEWASRFRTRVAARRIVAVGFHALFLLMIVISLAGLAILLAQVLFRGVPWLSWHFIWDYPSRFPAQAGMRSAIFGSIWVIGMSTLFTVPVGVGAAVYLEEYARKGWLSKVIEINIANLAGVPSIVYGLLGLAVFVQLLSMGRSVLAGSLTLSLLVLPIVIVASREAIRSVPATYRQAAYALGATRYQVVAGVVLPQALPGIMTGVILAMSRAIGEAAPMIAIAALVYLTFIPSDPLDRYTVMPIQIFNWVSRPQEGFRGLAAAGIIVLLAILFVMNAAAVVIRNKTQHRSEE
ncbi:MAG: phosphate ABC transporter permease PstA [Chloroflexi bacterium]|nr:phosphate ABC transporter permease PstA [Chloroflexota bacterium]